MTTEYYQRMGDGRRVQMTKEEIISDIEDGSNFGAEKGRVPELTDDEKEHLLDIFLAPETVVSVNPEDRIVFSADAGPLSIYGNYGEFGGVGIPTDITTSNMVLERVCGHDIVIAVSPAGTFKSVKPLATQMQQEIESTLMSTINPMLFIDAPNLGAYFKPDGPYENATTLISEGEIEKGMSEYEAAMPALTEDIVWTAEAVAGPMGVECMNMDTTAAAGDGDFIASLKATEEIKKKTKMSVLMGMANEYVLGVHGGLQYDGKIVAGMYPHEQVKIAAKAGVDIFGSVVNTNTKKSTPWNVAKTVALTKQCVKDSDIPVHANLGMGVCGVPMVEIAPIDAVSRSAKALVEIADIDGV